LAARSVDHAPRTRRAWCVVTILSLLYAVSFIDRLILSLLADPVSRELGLSDQKMGLLLGAGFAVMYALVGLPIAQQLDLRNRRTIVCCGVVLWSVSTIASAFATGVISLGSCRAGVAIGEAVLGPAAISLIADLFPRERRALPVSIFTAVAGLMVFGAFIVGGMVLSLATALETVTGMTPWRGTLILVGLPGLFLAAVLALTVREPARTGYVADRATKTDTAGFLRHIGRYWRFYVPFLLGSSLLVMFSYGMLAWIPTLLIRAHGLSPSAAGYAFGAVGVPAVASGTLFFGWLASRLERRGRPDGIVVAFLIATVAVTPFLVLSPLGSSLPMLLGGMALAIFGTSATATLPSLALQAYGPPWMRARLLALALLCTSLIGFALGPSFVALLSKQWTGDAAALGKGLSALGCITGPSAAFCFAISRSGLKQLLSADRPQSL
jgi:MFS family permease